MHALRLLIRRHSLAAALLFAAALALRILVPGGFMPTLDHGRIVVTICNGSPGATMVMAIPGLEHKAQPTDGAQGKCAFADLSLAMTGGADTIQLAVALAFVLALGLALALTLPPHPAARLRPPLRGPPRPA